MEEIFRKYSEGSRTGLLGMTMATGSGKTHAMVHFIAQYLIDIDEGRISEPHRIIVTSSQKKNLPRTELKEALESLGRGDLYEKYVLFLDSYVDLIRDNYEDWMEDDIRQVVPNQDTLDAFFSTIPFMKNSANDDAYSFIRGELSKPENRFRKSVRYHLRSAYRQKHEGKNPSNPDQLLSFIDREPGWAWLPTLYPQVLTSKKMVFFMSVDKFMLKNDTVVGSSYTIFDSDIVKGSIVFIDEFDQSKSTMERRLIQNNLDNIRDSRDSFEKIFKKLSNVGEQPRRLYSVSAPLRAKLTAELEKDPKYAHMSEKDKEECVSNRLYAIREDILKDFREISEKFKLDTVFKLSPDASEDTAFLFHDRKTSYISNSKKFINIGYDESENVNSITFTDSNDGLGFVQDLFAALHRAHRRFYGFVRMLASNYQQNQIDRSISFEDSIRSVLEEFMITGKLQDSIVSEILLMPSREQKKKQRIDESFYDSGFRYYSFEDDDSHGFRSDMRMVFQNITPEKVLLSICGTAMVFGISATANLKTTIGNYDLKYLKRQLRENFYELSQEDQRILDERFNNANSGYSDDQIIIHEVTDVENGAYNEDCWKPIIQDNLKSLQTFQYVQNSSGSEFFEKRYLKAAKAFHGFVVNSDITAMLAFFNKQPKEEDREFDRSVLENIFNIIVDENADLLPEGFSYKDNVVFLNKTTLDSERSRLDELLGSGRKMFVITTYGTLGAGQNLQYTFNEAEPVAPINGFGRNTKKDYNAIYVEKPTNIIPFYPVQGGTPAQLMEHIFTLEYLFQNREITESLKIDGIKAAFLGSRALLPIRGKCNDTRSARLNAAGTVIQAIGRICRTNMKSPKIHIFADSGLRTIFTDPPNSYGKCINLETRKLIETMHSESEDAPLCPMEEAALYDSQDALAYINRIRSRWSDENIGRWVNLRDFVLRYPVDPPLDSDEYTLYVKTPSPTNRYSYHSDDDFRRIDIHFHEPSKGDEVVSEDSARLQDLLKIGFVREHFESQGYATGFSEGTCLLSPPLFKNIYKGALGEITGRLILEQFGMELYDLPRSDYELFDFLIRDDIAVDFKHWSSATFTDAEEQYPKILQKMDSAGIRKAFIVNILKSGDYKPVSVKKIDDKEIVEIAYLYDPEKNEFNKTAIDTMKGCFR